MYINLFLNEHMNNSVNYFATIMATCLLLACHSNTGSKETVTGDTVKQGAAAPVILKEQPVTAIIKDDQLQAVYEQYTKLVGALTTGNDRQALIAGNALEAGARNMNKGGAIAGAAAALTSAADLAARRVLLAALSDEMITSVKKAGLRSGALYVDFCPMALDDKGAYWLSPEKEVRNPYFGAEMIDCGVIKDTIH
jgi:hypothetical protein